MANDSIVSTRPSNALKGAPRHTLRRRPLRFPNKAAKYMAWILRLATNLWQSPWCGACPRGVAAQLWRSRGARGSHCTALPHSAGFTAARAGHHHARRSSCGPGGAYMNWIRELDMNNTGFYKMKPRSCKILRARRRAARGAGVRPPTMITRRHFFSTAPSRMSSATVERPAPIARQRACGAQRRKGQCHECPHSSFLL